MVGICVYMSKRFQLKHRSILEYQINRRNVIRVTTMWRPATTCNRRNKRKHATKSGRKDKNSNDNKVIRLKSSEYSYAIDDFVTDVTTVEAKERTQKTKIENSFFFVSISETKIKYRISGNWYRPNIKLGQFYFQFVVIFSWDCAQMHFLKLFPKDNRNSIRSDQVGKNVSAVLSMNQNNLDNFISPSRVVFEACIDCTVKNGHSILFDVSLFVDWKYFRNCWEMKKQKKVTKNVFTLLPVAKLFSRKLKSTKK